MSTLIRLLDTAGRPTPNAAELRVWFALPFASEQTRLARAAAYAPAGIDFFEALTTKLTRAFALRTQNPWR